MATEVVVEVVVMCVWEGRRGGERWWWWCVCGGEGGEERGGGADGALDDMSLSICHHRCN